MIRTILLTMATLAVAACGGGGIEDTVSDFYSAQRSVVEKVCSCEDDPAACEAENAVSSTEEACLKDVLAEHDTPEVNDALDCVVAAANQLVSCINPVSCDDQTGAASACFETYSAAVEACPDVPADVDAATEACFPE